MQVEESKGMTIKKYKNYGNVQSGEIPSQAPITHQARLRSDKSLAPTPKDTCFHGFSKPAPQVQVMMKTEKD
jgi:hypothetical protein